MPNGVFLIRWFSDPGFSYSTKLLHLELPSVAEIEAHPNMAYVPPTRWIHGRELEQRIQGNWFSEWILRPPTVQQYIPIARALMPEAAG